MSTFFKYFGFICLAVIAGSMAFCSVGIYQVGSQVSRYFEGADTYTCQQFIKDINDPASDKMFAFALAGLAFGKGSENAPNRAEIEARLETEGFMPSVQKIYLLCQKKPGSTVLNVMAGTLAAPAISNTTPSSATVPTRY